MPVFVLTYDLRTESGTHDYQVLWDELERLGAYRFQDSAWLISLNNTAHEVRDHFGNFMDSNDFLFVSVVHRGEYGFTFARAGTNQWLKENPPS